MTTLQLIRHTFNQPATRINYEGTARMWRSIAHSAALEGDFEAMRQSQFRALENEQLAREQEAKRLNGSQKAEVGAACAALQEVAA
jgi:hypothetical protein